MIIKVVAVGVGLIGVIEVTEGGEFAVTRVIENEYKRPLEARLKGILAEGPLPLCVPVPTGSASGVLYCQKGDKLYPYAVANEFSYATINNLVVRGEVVDSLSS